MPLRIITRKGSAHLYLRGTVRGIRVFETTGTNDTKVAEALRIKRENDLLERSVFGAGATVTFAEAASSYIAAGGEAKYLGSYEEVTGRWSLLIGEFGMLPVATIKQVEADHAAHKLYPGTSAATRRRQFYVPLKAVMNHAAEKWEITVPAIKGPKVKPKPVDHASPDYVRQLLPHCAPSLRRFVAVLVYTGERLEKVWEIDWDRDVDLRDRTIAFPTTKNGEPRTCHIPDDLLIELTAVPESARHGRMFHWSDKRHVHKPLRSACKRAGLRYLSPHKLGRHTFATWLRKAGRDLRGVMQDGGWKSINSVVRYTHATPGETKAWVDQLPSVQNPCSSNVKTLKDRRIKKKIA